MESFKLFVIAGVLSFLIGFPARTLLLRLKVMDVPNERSSHKRPTARGGGLGIMVVLLGMTAVAGLSFEWELLVGAATVVALVSFIDDLRSVSALVRFGCHAAMAACALGGLIFCGERGELLQLSFGTAVLCIGVLFVWLVGYTNAFNFMDGINGLAAGQAVITGVGMGLVAGVATGQWAAPSIVACFVVGGTAVGFLPHNFPQARMFMGDVGSAPLGFLLAGLVILVARDCGWWLIVPLGALHMNFVLDTGITLIRRVLRRERWFEAHREHFYQRLIRSGESHTFTTLFEMGLQSLVICLLLFYQSANTHFRLSLIATIVVTWVSFIVWVEIRFRRLFSTPIQTASSDR